MKRLFLFLLPFLFSFQQQVDKRKYTLQDFKKEFIVKMSQYNSVEFKIQVNGGQILESDSNENDYQIEASVIYRENHSDSLTPFLYKVRANGFYKCSNGVDYLYVDSVSKIVHTAKIKPTPFLQWKEINYNQNKFLPPFMTNARKYINYLTDVTQWDKIIFNSDTIFNNQSCYRLYTKVIDTDFVTNIIYGPFIQELYVDKITMTPVYFSEYTEVMGYRNIAITRISNVKKVETVIQNFNCEIDWEGYKNYSIVDDILVAEKNIEKEIKLKKNLKIGTKAPDWQAFTLQDSLITNKNFTNRFSLIDFSYTSCFYCIKCIPALNKISEKYKDLNVFWLDGHDKSPIVIKNFINRNKINFEVYYKAKKAEEDFGVLGNPHLFLINPQGIIVEDITGYSEDFEQSLDSIISQYVKK